jgi:hypothetical protein
MDAILAIGCPPGEVDQFLPFGIVAGYSIIVKVGNHIDHGTTRLIRNVLQ